MPQLLQVHVFGLMNVTLVYNPLYLTGHIVTHKQAETITEKLDQYRKLSLDDQKLTKTEITKRMGFSAKFQHFVFRGVLVCG